MTLSLRAVAFAAVLSSVASVAAAVTTTPFTDPLPAGDSTFGSLTAGQAEDFMMSTISFTADGALSADVSITINPFMVSPGGIPSNSIALSYSIDGGGTVGIPITAAAGIGAAGLTVALDDGETLSFFVNGVAGISGNQVTFAVETTATGGQPPVQPPVTPPSAVPVTPAGMLALTGLGALLAFRRRKS